jgi:hypothetical protein
MCSPYGQVEVVDEKHITTAPSKTAYLLISGAKGVGVDGIANVKGTSKVEGCAEEGASEGVAVMDGFIDIGLGMNELFNVD